MIEHADLFAFQRTGAEWLASRDRALLADEMGLGKTAQALCALPDGAAVLVVCPAVVKGVWEAEARRWRPDLSVTVLHGQRSFRWPTPGEIVVLNYEILPDWAGEPIHPVVVIGDEAHAVKSPRAKRTKRFRELAHDARKAGGRTWLLTGTPLLNDPPELWSLLKAADLHEEAFSSWPRFCQLFDSHLVRIHTSTGPRLVRKFEVPRLPFELRGLRRVMLRRRRAEVLPQLPGKIHREHLVQGLPVETRQLADELVRALAEHGIDLTAATEVATLARIQSLSFDLLAKVRAALAAAKIPALVALVETFEASEEPVVVFSAHRAPIDALARREGWAAITGDVSHEERTRIVSQFQRGELCGLAMTRAGGMGITLTRANQMIVIDQDWTPGGNDNIEDRLCRISQTRGVIITRLVADHLVDVHVTRVLARKQALIASTIEAPATASEFRGAPPNDRGARPGRAILPESSGLAVTSRSSNRFLGSGSVVTGEDGDPAASCPAPSRPGSLGEVIR